MSTWVFMRMINEVKLLKAKNILMWIMTCVCVVVLLMFLTCSLCVNVVVSVLIHTWFILHWSENRSEVNHINMLYLHTFTSCMIVCVCVCLYRCGSAVVWWFYDFRGASGTECLAGTVWRCLASVASLMETCFIRLHSIHVLFLSPHRRFSAFLNKAGGEVWIFWSQRI